jgi:glycosyltransferase involved in cell wall biosynthesis
MTSTVYISIVVPTYNEGGNVEVLYAALESVLKTVAGEWEIILVDDGSSDSTWKEICACNQMNKRVKGLRLSRNFGHQNALIAGLSEARGRAVICMDGDMQHPPSLIPELIKNWEEGYRIVKTKRRDPDDLPWLKRWTSKRFYSVFSYMSGVKLESGMADFRLLDRAVLDDLLKIQEHDLFLRGLVEWVGYESITIEYDCEDRLQGESKYTVRKMLRFAWDGISSFSLVPLRAGVLVGLSASALSLLATVYAITSKLISGETVSGWSSTLAIISFLFGVMFLYLGLLGEYLGRTLIETRSRPRYLVSDRKGMEQGSHSGRVSGVVAPRSAAADGRMKVSRSSESLETSESE